MFFSGGVEMITASILVVCLFVALAASSALPCQSTVRGKTYNLQAVCHANGYAAVAGHRFLRLLSSTGVDWVYKTNYNTTYYINVCNNLVSSNPCGNDAPAYAYDTTTGTCFRLGLLEAEWWGNSCT